MPPKCPRVWPSVRPKMACWRFLLLTTNVVSAVNVLIVYADIGGETKALADAFASGAAGDPSNAVRVLQSKEANYKRDVLEWADAVAIGSSVINGNADPSVLDFINSFDVDDVALSRMPVSSFATGGSAAAGLQPTMEQINRALLTFRCILVGGDSWQNGEGTGAVREAVGRISTADLTLATAHGRRLAWVSSGLQRGLASPPPLPTAPPPPAPAARTSPPRWGSLWSAQISANLTQVGYDAGLVMVNFSTACGAEPRKQQMRTVYGDFYTVLTRCDLGYEFTIAPASRGSGCSARLIGKDVDKRVCEACACPFCVRDTNGRYSHGQYASSSTVWAPPANLTVGAEILQVWRGTATAAGSRHGGDFALTTDLGFRLDGTPVLVNVSHPLWVQTQARVQHFQRSVPTGTFDIPPSCLRPLASTNQLKSAAAVLPLPSRGIAI